MKFLSSTDMLDISGAAYNAVFDAFRNPTQSEPQLVANLVWQLPYQINKVQFSSGVKVSAGGVFVHAQPFVTCASFPEITPNSVEIGDLLLIRSLVQKNVVVERRALLLQAKKVNRVPTTPDNQNQWHLYEQWPKFTYAKNSGILTGKKRHIREPDMYDAAKYLFIGQAISARELLYTCGVGSPFYWYPGLSEICLHQTAQPTTPEVSRFRCFANELVQFLAGNAGKVFTKPKPKTQGWDRVIQDLVCATANMRSIYAGRAAGQPTSAMRGSGVLFFSLTGQSSFSLFGGGGDNPTNNFNKPPDVPADSDRDDNGGGISIIEFVVEQGEG